MLISVVLLKVKIIDALYTPDEKKSAVPNPVNPIPKGDESVISSLGSTISKKDVYLPCAPNDGSLFPVENIGQDVSPVIGLSNKQNFTSEQNLLCGNICEAHQMVRIL